MGSFHTWASWEDLEPGSLDALIRAASSWEVVGVLVVAVGRRIAVHPYDGGLDVILPTTKARDRWRERYIDWASPLESGL